MEEPPSIEKKNNEIAAGEYTGFYYCSNYLGAGQWVVQQSSGNSAVQALGDDQLVLSFSDGCLNVTQPYNFVADTTFFDTLSMTALPVLQWKGTLEQYQSIFYYPMNDSISIQNPSRSSQGWLTRFFLGKRI